MPQLFTEPESYIATYTSKEPLVDGNINDEVWKQAAWTRPFVDIEGISKPLPYLATRAKMLWNDSCLFIAAQLQEPHLWAKLNHRDQIVFRDNDFEIFIDPDNDTRQYFEIEVNALNTIFDLYLSKPYRSNGGPLFSWNAPGMLSAVKLQGSLNNASDRDTSWTVEFKIPFAAINIGNEVQPPHEGSLWRINFSRVEWNTEVKQGAYVKSTGTDKQPLPEHNWVWSSQGIINMHFPERWGYIQFTKSTNSNNIKFSRPYSDLQKQYLWLIYYTQQQYYKKHHSYATSLKELGINEHKFAVNGKLNSVNMQGNQVQFSATINDGSAGSWCINNDGLIQSYKL